MTDGIKVSVFCTAYNHEKYIRQCLEGFVSQKTDFPYECIIHDDASTDGTAAIIREYAERYPDIIKPIYQTENQFSQGVNITVEHMLPIARGKYIALCEGDDYWIDPLKLRKQTDAMEQHPECHMCVCKVECISEDESITLDYYPDFDFGEKMLSSDEFLDVVLKKQAFQTSSFFFRAEDVWTYTHPFPKFRQVCPVGDVPYLLYFGQLGSVYYLPDTMSRYRCGSIGSWTESILGNRDKRIQHCLKMEQTYLEYDRFTNGQYHELCLKAVFYYAYCAAETKEDFRALLHYRENTFRAQSARRKIGVLLGAYAPALLEVCRKLVK